MPKNQEEDDIVGWVALGATIASISLFALRAGAQRSSQPPPVPSIPPMDLYYDEQDIVNEIRRIQFEEQYPLPFTDEQLETLVLTKMNDTNWSPYTIELCRFAKLYYVASNNPPLRSVFLGTKRWQRAKMFTEMLEKYESMLKSQAADRANAILEALTDLAHTVLPLEKKEDLRKRISESHAAMLLRNRAQIHLVETYGIGRKSALFIQSNKAFNLRWQELYNKRKMYLNISKKGQ